MHHFKYFQIFLAMVLLTLGGLGTGCESQERAPKANLDVGVPPDTDSETDTGTERDVTSDDISIAEDTATDTNQSEAGDATEDDEGFRKPDVSAASHLETTPVFPTHSEDTPRTTGFGPGARPHMMATRVALESWLYPGEFFVIDYSVVRHNMHWLPSDYFFIVTHDGERLPFRIVEVGPAPFVPFPSMEEIESWDEEKFDTSAIVYRQDGVPFNHTLVIPPWAFPEEGAYNVQVLYSPLWEPFEGAPQLAMKPWITGAQTQGSRFTTHTIYYGDTEFVANPESHKDRQDEAEEWSSTVPGPFMAQTNFMLLAPPFELCDWSTPESPYDTNECLSKELTSSQQELTLNFYVAGVDETLIRSDTTGQNLYYLMRDDEVIDTFLFEPSTSDYSSMLSGTDRGDVLSIDVELSESRSAYQLFAIPEPFTPQVEGELDLMSGNFPVESNTLLLRYEPDD